MIEFDVETTGLQPWSGRHEAFLWIFWDGDDPTNAEAIPFMPSGAPLESWGVGPCADRIRQNPHLTALAEQANADTLDRETWERNRARVQAWFDRAKAEGIRAWNAKFDRGFADASECFDVPGDGCWHDGMVTAHTIDERRSVALKAVASSLFGDEVADPQKAVKGWLNDENKRRRKVENDAKKAVNGTLKIEELIEETCPDDCEGGCPACGGLGYVLSSVKRRATDEECAAVIAEAKLYRHDDGDFVYANFSDVPREIMEPYALDDVFLTRKVCDTYEPILEQKPDLARTVEFEREAMDAIYGLERRGLPADLTGYRKLEQEVTDNLAALEDRVHELAHEGDPVVYAKALAGPKNWGKGKHFVEVDEAGQVTSYEGGAAVLDEFNPNSTPQILAALKARGADMSYMSEKDGRVSADAENLRAVDDALAAAILNFRSEFKVLSTYVRPMIGRSYVSALNTHKEPFIAPDGRIHATYRQVGARTGRMSCADPNMQNQPRDDLRLRYNIRAEPGHVLVTADLTNIEMYLFAAYCGEGRLLDAVQKGEDLHVLTAKMLGLRDRARPGGGVETARQLGKTYNFSRIYGGGLRTIRRSFRCSLDEARLLKRRFDDAYPEVATLTARIQNRLETDGYIQDKLISGRRFRVAPRDSYKGVNHLVQGTAAALLKYATIQLHKDGVPMVALVHDEVLAHVPVADAERTADLLVERLTEFEGLKGKIPLKAEADIVLHWSDAKPLQEKDAKGNPVGDPYLFTPQWAGGERRPVMTTDEVLREAA